MILARKEPLPKELKEVPSFYGVIHTKGIGSQPFRREVFKYANMTLYLANGGKLKDFKANDLLIHPEKTSQFVGEDLD